jgi:hypothetical protein
MSRSFLGNISFRASPLILLAALSVGTIAPIDSNVKSVIALISLLAFPGWWVAGRLVRSRYSVVEGVALSSLLSLVSNTTVLFYLGVLGILRPGYVLMAYLLMNGAIFLAVHGWTRSQKSDDIHTHGLDLLSVIAGALCVSVLILNMIQSSLLPFSGWDAIAFDNRWAVEVSRSGEWSSMGDFGVYPQGFPASYLWVYMVSGTVNEYVAHVVTPIMGILAVMYTWLLSSRLGGKGGLAAFLFVGIPLVGYQLHAAFLELPCAAFVVASSYYLVRGLGCNREHRIHLALSGIMAGASAWMKTSGILIVFILPFMFLAGSIWFREKKAMLPGLAVVLGSEVLTLHWYWFTFLTQGLSPFLRSAANLGSAAALWGVPNPTLLERLSVAFTSLVGMGNSTILAIAFVGGLFIPMMDRRARLLTLAVTVPFLMIWLLQFGYDGRYLVAYIPLLCSVSSATWSKVAGLMGTKPIFKIRIGRIRQAIPIRPSVIIALCLCAALAPAAAGSIVQAAKGPGPGLAWTLSHASSSLDEKRLVLLGPMYDMVLFVRENRTLHDSRIVTMDSRIPAFLENASFEWPCAVESLQSYDYLIVANWAFTNPAWNYCELAKELSLRIPIHLKMVVQFSSQQDAYALYAILEPQRLQGSWFAKSPMPSRT